MSNINRLLSSEYVLLDQETKEKYTVHYWRAALLVTVYHKSKNIYQVNLVVDSWNEETANRMVDYVKIMQEEAKD